MDCPQVSEEEVAAVIKGLKMEKAAGPTSVVSEMMNASGGFDSRWMTDLINNIVVVVVVCPLQPSSSLIQVLRV